MRCSTTRRLARIFRLTHASRRRACERWQLARWSPEGTQIVFRSNRAGVGDVYQKLSSCGGMEDRLIASDLRKTPISWSADGRFLIYSAQGPQTATDLWVLPMVGNHTPSVFLQTPFSETGGVFSPDGRWVAYQSNESGQNEIYLRAFVPPGGPTARSCTT